MTASQAFSQLDPYHRGAWTMHTLRFHLGDKKFFSLLKHWVYPDTSDTDNTKGRLCRFANTNDMKELAEKITNRDLDPFFDVFMKEASYPYLEITYSEKGAVFTWKTENDVLLDLDVPVMLNGLKLIVKMKAGQGILSLPLQYDLVIDPDQWILMDEPQIASTLDPEKLPSVSRFQLHQNFPNPFNPKTIINYELSIANDVDLSIYNLLGQKVATLVSEKQNAGYHQVEWDASGFASGLYYYKIKSGEFMDMKKMILLR
jgi:hypothetical protein